MPDDKRLYMTFPIDIHRHPKITRLPVEVRWTFVEMNGEARLADNDGVFEAIEAEFMWPMTHLAALSTSHPTRPLVINTGDSYVIRDYSEHQLTREARQRKAEVSRENGQKGGRPKGKRTETQTEPSWVSDGTQTEPNRTQLKAESESESKSELEVTDISGFLKSSHLPKQQVADADSGSDLITVKAQRAGIADLSKLRGLLERTCKQPVSDRGAVLLVEAITSKSPIPVSRVDAYIATACRKTPDEVCEAYFDLDIGGMS